MSSGIIRSLPWDTAFLGFRVARVVAQAMGQEHLAALVASARATDTRLIYVFCDPADNAAANALQRAGAQLVDRKVTFARLVHAGTPPATKDAGRFEIHQTTTYTAQLEALAWQSGEFSRFQRDGTFAPTVFVDLYSHWLRASLTGELARAVFCATLAGQESGLLTLEDHGEYASIGLLAAGAAWRGQGIGKALIGQALREAELWGCAQVRVATQRENVPACRFYARCGFDVVREEHVYHLWL